MLRIDRTVRAEVAAPPERCMAVLADVERYPSWASLIAAVEPPHGERDGLDRFVLRAQALGFKIEMRCTLDLDGERAVLRRVPYDGGDEERFETAWRVAPAGTGSRVELRVVAALDVPGPARLLGGRMAQKLVDDLLAEFTRAV